jgi:hypothetical protein
VQGSLIGVGPALRKARLARRRSLEEASRETRIRLEYLEALERESFSELMGEVYVRGCLRTYAAYLGLSPDKVVAAYARNTLEGADELEDVPAQPPARTATSAPVIRPGRHGIAMAVAAALIVTAVAFGVLSRSNPVPAPLTPSPDPVAHACSGAGVSVAVTGQGERVGVRIVADGQHSFAGRLAPGDTRTFVAKDSLTLHLSRGGSALVSVDCTSLGAPGMPGQPYEDTFTRVIPGGAASTPQG